MKSIAFVESKHKINKVKWLLENRWPGELFDVFYSGGTLLSLPRQKINILAKDSLNPTGFQLTDSGRNLSHFIKEKLNAGTKWKYCLLLTDDDWEGESIADQLTKILFHLCPLVVFYRMKIPSLDAKTFKEAKLLNSLDNNVIHARDGRVAADSLINSFLTSIVGIPASARPGRVVCAVAKMLYANSGVIPTKILQLARGMPDGEVALAQIVNPTTDPRVYVEQARRVDADSFTSYSLQHSSPPKPFNIFDLATEITGFEIENGLQLAQHLYASGKISYFRTEENFYSDNVAEEMRHFLQKFHLKSGSGAVSDGEHGQGIYGAHGGIYPLTHNLLSAQFTSEPVSILERLISARALASQMGNAVYKVGYCSTGKSYCTEFKSIKFIEKGWTAAYERLGLPNPITGVSPELRKGRICRRSISSHVLREQFAFQWLAENRVAKPPTIASLFPMLKASGWMDRDGRVSTDGEAWMSKIYKRAPALLEPAFSRDLYSKLSQVAHGHSNPGAVINFVLTELNISQGELSDMGVVAEREHSPWINELKGL